MLSTGLVVLVSSLYLGGLFLLAYISDRRAARGAGSFINSPLVYTLSLAVYCTSWTFYGAVGSAARSGPEYLTIYLGPTLVLMGWWYLLRKLVHICREQKITSIADFISARYGKSGWLSALVTLIALIGVTPYIALQLQAVAASFNALTITTDMTPAPVGFGGVLQDTGFWVALSMSLFVILFGTRNLSADERHPGVVAAIAFESLVKLFSLGAVALFALYGLSHGVQGLFETAHWHEGVQRLRQFPDGFEPRWVALTFLSATAFICLPRQFQVTVLENASTRHLATAAWLFPLYMLLVSLFVIPIAVTGMTQLPETANPDLYVVGLPLSAGRDYLALLAFIGGLSAATSMVIVASIALSIMISNHWVTPLLLHLPFFEAEGHDFSKVLLLVRRLAILAILTLGFSYYSLVGAASSLASIGLISFVGVAQFLPALLGGIYWDGGTKAGATAGLMAGFLIWAYTLLLPSFGASHWIYAWLTDSGPFGLVFMKPHALFGFEDWDPIVHGLLWSLSGNVVLYLVVSVTTRQSPLERLQSAVFVDVFDRRRGGLGNALQRSATTDDLFQLAQRILGPNRANRIFENYGRRGQGGRLPQSPDPAFIGYVERELASSIGAASARTLVSRIAKGETISLDAVISLLDETQAIIRYSHELERKSRELEETAGQLRHANEQLTRLDKMKDDFLSRVSHELRTPMTSICSFSEVLVSQHDLDDAQTRRFLGIIQHESVRLTRLLDEILDLSRMENGEIDWALEEIDAVQVTRDALDTMRGMADTNAVTLVDRLGAEPAPAIGDADRLKQVFVNLLSNAVKFNDSADPRVWIERRYDGTADLLSILVRDNGPGVREEDQPILFSKFARGWEEQGGRIVGSGLGLAISKQIMGRLGGDLSYAPAAGGGACFIVTLQRPSAARRRAI